MWAWGYNDKGALGVLDSHDAGNNYSSPDPHPEVGLFEQAFQNTLNSAISDTTHVLELSQLSQTEIKTRNASVKVVEALSLIHI